MKNGESAGKLLATLKRLAGEAGANYYRRIEAVDQLLQNREWIDLSFKGDDYKAAEILEEEYLHDLSGSLTVWQLLTIYRKFPNESDWQKHKYNLRALSALCKPEQKRTVTRTTVKVAEFEAAQQRAKEAQYRAKQLEKNLSDRDAELESLRRRVVQLEAENEQLKGQVAALEKVVHGKLAS